MKNITYVHDFCLLKSEDERIYTAVGLPESYFHRFFDAGANHVIVLTRNKYASTESIKNKGFEAIQKKNITVPIQLKNYFSLLNPFIFIRIIFLIKKSDLLVINFPSIFGFSVWFINLFFGKKYAVEVAADFDQFKSKKFGFVPTIFFKYFFKRVIDKSVGSIFVSNYLANKYPHPNCSIASNVNLFHVFKSKSITNALISNSLVTLSFAGGLNKRKGIDVLINAIRILVDKGVDNLCLNIAGGHADLNYEILVKNLGLDKYIKFHGILSKDDLNKLLSNTDLYIQPSLSEGIPRATIEAMSHGLPVVATNLPGFIEILHPDALVEMATAELISDKILLFMSDMEIYNFHSYHNFLRSKDFIHSDLHKIRVNFYNKVLK